jgi:hypothetical protein
MKKLALVFALALATTPAFARAGGGGHGSFHGGGIHTGRSVGFHGGGYRGGYRHVYRGGGYGYGYNGSSRSLPRSWAKRAVMPVSMTLDLPEALDPASPSRSF